MIEDIFRLVSEDAGIAIKSENAFGYHTNTPKLEPPSVQEREDREREEYNTQYAIGHLSS
jgi:hypothetical protein